MSNSFKDNRKESFAIWNNDEDKELYSYAARLLGQWALNTVAVLLIAIALKMVPECLLMLGSFLLIRKFAGGYHSKSFAVCFLSSVLILTGGLMVIKHFSNFSAIMWIVADVISIVFFVCLPPVENPNKPMINNEKRKYHTITIVLSIVLFFLSVFLLMVLDDRKKAYAMMMGLILALIPFLGGSLKLLMECGQRGKSVKRG